MLITQTGRDHLDTSITNEESQRQNTMPTFENMIRSAKVLEGALKHLAPADRIDLAGAAAGTLGCPPASEPVGQGDPLDQHPGGELSLEGPAGGGERGAGGRPIVPRFHGPHAQGNGRRDQPDADPGAGRLERETEPEAGGVAGVPPPLRRHGLPLRRQDAASDGAAGGVLQRCADRRAEAAGGAGGPAGDHSDGDRQRRGPGAVHDVAWATRWGGKCC